MKLERNVLISLLVVLGFCFLGVPGCIFFGMISRHPPKDAKVIGNFQGHRAAFEKLRDMIQQDPQLDVVAEWGSRLDNGKPLPVARYNSYMQLLNEVQGYSASRAGGPFHEPTIALWGWGWAGDARHEGISWLEQSPTNQIASFDNYSGRSAIGKRVIVYRHVDTNWYFWTDL